MAVPNIYKRLLILQAFLNIALILNIKQSMFNYTLSKLCISGIWFLKAFENRKNILKDCWKKLGSQAWLQIQEKIIQTPQEQSKILCLSF